MNATTVDEYLQAVPNDAREALEGLRAAIRRAAPGATESISYGVPTFRLKKALVGYGAATRHCSFYLMSTETMQAFSAELANYDAAKGTIRFVPGKALPESLVARLVAARIKEIGAE